MKKHHAYLIKWDDSASLRGWKPMATVAHHTTAMITSIGWLVHETKASLTITTSIDDEGGCMDVLCIPKHAIKSKRRLPNYIANMTPS